MNGTFWVGIVLVLLGTALLVYQGFSYDTKTTTAIGPIDITVPKKERVLIPPVIGGVVLALGLFITYLGYKKGSH